jgi:cytidylate kinase
MNLIFIYGPAAVGKMTVGNELSKITEFKLFHNHATIDIITPIFPFETPQFRRLCNGFRMQMFEEVAASDIPGIIFTFAWAFNHQPDTIL